MSSRREAAAADAVGRPQWGRRSKKKLRKAEKMRLGRRGKLARMNSRREVAAADAAERPGCIGGGGARRSFEKPKVETWAPRMSSHREAPAASAAGRPSCNGKGEQEEASKS